MIFMVVVFAVFVLLAVLSLIFNIELQTFKSVLSYGGFFNPVLTAFWTSLVATAAAVLVAIPVGYSLSRFRFPGRFLVNILADIPLVLPPFISVLAIYIFALVYFFGSKGENTDWLGNVLHPAMLIPCQFIGAVSILIRSAKMAFDKGGIRHEHIALTLGSSRWGSFCRVGLPMAADGIISGVVLTWLRAFGIFTPLLIFSDSFSGMAEKFKAEFFQMRGLSEPEVVLAIIMIIVSAGFLVLLFVRTVGVIIKKVRGVE